MTLARTIDTPAAIAGTPPVALLTPNQQWFFDLRLSEPHHWNQAFAFEVPPTLDLEMLEEAVKAVVAHHDGFRLRYLRGPAGWHQHYTAEYASMTLERHDLSTLPDDDRARAFTRIASELQTTLDLSRGPMIRAAHFRWGGGHPDRVLFIVHQLVIDGASWRILLDDIDFAYTQIHARQSPMLPPKTSSIEDLGQYLLECSADPELALQEIFWTRVAQPYVPPLPRENATIRSGLEHHSQSLTLRLPDVDVRALAQQLAWADDMRLCDALLAALGRSFHALTQSNVLRLDFEDDTRPYLFEGLDVSRTIGWFSPIFPLALSTDPRQTALESVYAVRHQIRAVPNGGIGYGVMRYVASDMDMRAAIERMAVPEVAFRFLGPCILPVGVFSKLASEWTGPSRGSQSRRPYLIEVTALVHGAELRVDWAYSNEFHAPETIAWLAQQFMANVRALAACLREIPD
jgi:non-ribosomal peptide synthase protein (TIGR01720 family)